MYHVFVYGTLKEGFPNFKINKGIRVNGTFVTKYRYPFYLVGERYSPWLILDQGNGNNVKGQVFQIDQSALDEMDKLERIDKQDGYKRVEIQVISEDSGEEVSVFMYGKPIEQLENAFLRSDPLDDYKLEHSKLYRSRNS